MNYPDSVRFLYSLGNEVPAAKLGLDRVAALLEALGNPQRAFRSVHVAGTNGKGSTSAMIESGLRAAGFHTGLYTSPHLVEPTERIRIGGQAVDAERFAWAFEVVHAAAASFEEHPTYFETVTAMAFVLFREARVEWAVVEVGLGGRLDATNVIQPELAVITPVDFDHEAYLGKSLESIAAEKGGILKPGVRALFAPQRPEAARALEEAAEAAGVAPLRTERWQVSNLEPDAFGSRFELASLEIECRLPGEHQVDNARTAAVALGQLGVPPAAIERGIREARWPGRLERVAEWPDIFLDGAHNPAGARALARYIERFHAGRRVWLVYGAMRDKAVSEMAGILFPLAAEVILTAPHQPRAVRPELMREMVEHPSVRVAPDPAAALAALGEASPADVAFVTGSLFLVGETRALLVK